MFELISGSSVVAGLGGVACFVGSSAVGVWDGRFLLEVGSRQSASVGLLRAFPFEIRGAPFGFSRGVRSE